MFLKINMIFVGTIKLNLIIDGGKHKEIIIFTIKLLLTQKKMSER